jgi:MFS transporter, SP family, sugar:H+ symporter
VVFLPCRMPFQQLPPHASFLIPPRYWQDEFSTGFIDSKGHKNIDAGQTSEVVSILSAGTFFGALGAAPVADRIGRRFALIASCCVFSFGVILQTAATKLPMFVAGRFFAGFGVGLVSALSKHFDPLILDTSS